jgi:hypothetical protein
MNSANDKDSFGLIYKYRVERVNDPAGKHDKCFYFVLDPQHDKSARFALHAYAVSARKEGQMELYNDIMEKLKEYGYPVIN